MPGKWDTSMKHLLGENPEHFIKWLLPEAELTGSVELQPVNLNAREIEADNLCKAILNNKGCLVNFEFQSYPDDTMAKRMWEYNILATFIYELPTFSFVIYLKKCKVTKPYYTLKFPTGEIIHHFRFKVIELWKMSPEDIKRTSLAGIFPLMVLTKGGKQPAVVEEAITGIEALGGKSSRELLSLTYVIASLVFENKSDRKWLKRRFNMLRDALRHTWAYQEIMDEGREEERQQELQRQRQTLMTFIQTYFPNITQLANQQAHAVNDPALLQSIILKVVTTQTEEQVVQTLFSVNQENKQKQ